MANIGFGVITCYRQPVELTIADNTKWYIDISYILLYGPRWRNITHGIGVIFIRTRYGLAAHLRFAIHLSIYKLFNINKRISTLVIYKSKNREGGIAEYPLDGERRCLDEKFCHEKCCVHIYISELYGRHMFDVLRINSRLRVYVAATRLIYLRASDDVAAITSTNVDKKQKVGREGRKYVWMQCVNKRKN